VGTVAGPEKLTALTYIKRGGGRARHGRKATNAHRDKSRQRSSRRWSSDDDGKSICGSSSCSIGGREFPLRQARLRLGHRGRSGASYASPCYQLMILLRLVADPYGFSTGGYAESLLRDWWNARIACGDIVEMAEGYPPHFDPEQKTLQPLDNPFGTRL